MFRFNRQAGESHIYNKPFDALLYKENGIMEITRAYTALVRPYVVLLKLNTWLLSDV